MEPSELTLLVCFQNALESNRLEAWEQFVREAQPVVSSAVFRTLARWNIPQKDCVDDLVQETFLKLCAGNFSILRKLRSERPEAFVAYIRTVAASVATDSMRTKAALKRGAGSEPIMLDDALDAAAISPVEDIERKMLIGQIGKCLAAQADRDRQVFWMYYRHGLTSEAISAIRVMNLTSSGVESLLRRLTIVVRKCLKLRTANLPQTAKGNAG